MAARLQEGWTHQLENWWSVMMSDDYRRSLHFQVAFVGNDWTMLWMLWPTSEVTLPVLCASWPLLQGLCQSFRSLASLYVVRCLRVWVALNGENASPLELVGVDRGCQISRVLSCSFQKSFYLVLTHRSGMMRTMMMPLTRIRSVANVVERLLKGCSPDNWKVLVEARMQLAVGIQVLLWFLR